MEPINITQQELLANFGELTLVNGKLTNYIQNLEAENKHINEQLEKLTKDEGKKKK